jgi:hypothetical protein
MFHVHYKYNIALILFEYIDMDLGAVGICIPGLSLSLHFFELV